MDFAKRHLEAVRTMAGLREKVEDTNADQILNRMVVWFLKGPIGRTSSILSSSCMDHWRAEIS